MKSMETRKSPSWWWNSHVGPRNSKWLSENVEEVDRLVNETLKLIEADGDSFAKKAQMYYQRRPELISRVENFHRLYRAVAERYDQATIELAKHLSMEPRYQASCNGSEIGTEAATSASSPSSPDRSSELKVGHFGQRSKAAGFNFFLGSGENNADRLRRRSDESCSESGSESDYSKYICGYDSSPLLEARVIELENELREARDKLQETRDGFKEQCELLSNREELVSTPVMNFTGMEKRIQELEDDLPDYVEEFESFKEEMKDAAEQFEIEILRREDIIKEYKTRLGEMLNNFSSLEAEHKSDAAEAKADDGDVSEGKPPVEIKSTGQAETREMKAKARQSSHKLLLRERSVLEAQLCSLMISNNSYESKIQALEVRVKQLEAENSSINQILEDYKVNVDRLTSVKEELDARVDGLEDDLKARDDDSRRAEEYLRELRKEHKKQIGETEDARKALVDQMNKVEELEDEVERQRLLILDGAEGKREAIRQLCFSLEHYRVGYQELKQMLQVQHKRSTL